MQEPSNDVSRNIRIPLWYLLLLPLVFLMMQVLFQTERTQLAYSDFKNLLNAGKVSEANVADDVITGTLKADGLDQILPEQTRSQLKCKGERGCNFITVRVADPQLVEQMQEQGVRFTGQPKSEWFNTLLSWIIPLGLIFWLWGGLAKRTGMSSVFDIGKSKARVYVASKTGVTFDDVAGIDEAKDELMEVVEFLKNPERYRRLGGKIPKGVLIVGAPGTGKTLLAKALAGEAGVPFFSISGSEFVEMFVGVGAARVRDLFSQAEEKAPCIIFIDELDALGKARGVSVVGGANSEQEQTLNQLLVEMDGFDTNKGVIILAATNRPEILDPALLRPGRFDRHIALDRPDLKGREKILAVHAKHIVLSPEVDLSVVAARTAGFAGADLANLINEAALLAARNGKDKVGMDDIDEAIDRIVAGLQKKTRVMNPKEKETVAYHEAGHALIAELRPNADHVNKISIIPRGIAALGYTQQLPTEDRYLLKKAELLDRLDVYLGGRVAEELAFGDVSTGAQNDLQMATDMARHMVTQYGMSERLGLATFEEARAPFLYPSSLQEKKAYSENTAQVIDAEIARLIDDAHMRVKGTLTQHRNLLDTVARALLEKETLDREELRKLIEGTRAKSDSVEGG
ncbi:ATP-dependent zinc metalloprotease FtsH [Noviherbaspirillum sp.]|uniref:ATP-dependent zinc metalloprotease FtsH n=1 Tax=Noviherbaspirillum sp. TaxID=1926288 RepID=UPI002B467394|nr:ATP-dependent zinc metalloprotease FtsH [Noviherbaspirillum sp.]HJV79534.1 ATP-dependent zinc metalloprotease FtsH [Noviherbaspirillum sp.]